MMHILIMGIIVLSSLPIDAAAIDFKFSDKNFGKCANSDIGEPNQLYFTLREYFCLNERQPSDSAEIHGLEARLGKEVYPDNEQYKNADYRFWYAYSIAKLDNIIFLIAPDPVRAHYGILLNFIYSAYDDKIYSVGRLNKDDVNHIIKLYSYYSPTSESDRDALEYCRLYSILINGSVPIRFISSIEELLSEALFTDPVIFHLELPPDSLQYQGFYKNVNDWNNIKLGLPTLHRSNDEVSVSYYMAKLDGIFKVNMTIKGSDINDYEQHEFAKTLPWYGERPH